MKADRIETMQSWLSVDGPAIEVEGVSFRYPTTEGRWILDHLSFHVDAGEILGVVGPNGSGKSSLLKVLSGYLPAGEGEHRLRLPASIQRALSTVTTFRTRSVRPHREFLLHRHGRKDGPRSTFFPVLPSLGNETTRPRLRWQDTHRQPGTHGFNSIGPHLTPFDLFARARDRERMDHRSVP